jgi:hypothetical protein
LSNVEKISHRQVKAYSLINIPLWDNADWRGTGFAFSKNPNDIPALILGFWHSEFGIKIFQEWIEELGEVDQNDRLSITVIRGIDKNSPNDYRIAISEKPIFTPREEGTLRYLFATARVREMKSMSKDIFDGFFENYNRHGKYTLLPGQLTKDGGIEQPRFSKLIVVSSKIPSLIKTELKLIDAWKIGRNDFEACAIYEDDEVYIPEGIEKPPINELIAWKKQNAAKRK